MPNILDTHLSAFTAKCDWALKTYFDTVSLYNENKVDGFTADMQHMIIENLILNIWSSWEKFLEDIFIAYMLGNKSDNGEEVISYASPVDGNHAYNLIKSLQAYPEWTNIEKVLINADNFFEDCGAFKILKTLQADINAFKTIRNAIAHKSQKAQTDFENLVRGKTGHLPENITPSTFVSEYKSGKRKADPTFFQYYVEFLKNSSIMLVEFKRDAGV